MTTISEYRIINNQLLKVVTESSHDNYGVPVTIVRLELNGLTISQEYAKSLMYPSDYYDILEYIDYIREKNHSSLIAFCN